MFLGRDSEDGGLEILDEDLDGATGWDLDRDEDAKALDKGTWDEDVGTLDKGTWDAEKDSGSGRIVDNSKSRELILWKWGKRTSTGGGK